MNKNKQPWLEPNEFGEKPGDICCLRAIGKYCYEHDPANYTKEKKWPYILGWTLLWLTLISGSIWLHWKYHVWVTRKAIQEEGVYVQSTTE